jgi:hypothetical protein
LHYYNLKKLLHSCLKKIIQSNNFDNKKIVLSLDANEFESFKFIHSIIETDYTIYQLALSRLVIEECNKQILNSNHIYFYNGKENNNYHTK